MDIGEPKRVIKVAPLEAPAEAPGPVQEPLKEIEVPTPVPAGERSETRAVRPHRSPSVAALSWPR